MTVLSATTLQQLNNLLSQHKVVIVDFTATWCGPCKMIGPIAQSLSASKNVVLVKVDIDKAFELASTFHVQSVPQFYAFEGSTSNVLGQFTGGNAEKCEELFAIAASLL